MTKPKIAELERRCAMNGFTTPHEVMALLRLARAAKAVNDHLDGDREDFTSIDQELRAALDAFDWGDSEAQHE